MEKYPTIVLQIINSGMIWISEVYHESGQFYKVWQVAFSIEYLEFYQNPKGLCKEQDILSQEWERPKG